MAVGGFCGEVLRILKHADHGLAVVFVKAETMRELNSRYRGKDYATDVLSFGYGEAIVDHHPFLGEIVIAPEIAWHQAQRRVGQPEMELRKLLVHGILHLIGYDHETDAGEMNRLQRNLLGRTVLRRAPLLTEPRGVQ